MSDSCLIIFMLRHSFEQIWICVRRFIIRGVVLFLFFVFFCFFLYSHGWISCETGPLTFCKHLVSPSVFKGFRTSCWYLTVCVVFCFDCVLFTMFPVSLDYPFSHVYLYGTRWKFVILKDLIGVELYVCNLFAFVFFFSEREFKFSQFNM